MYTKAHLAGAGVDFGQIDDFKGNLDAAGLMKGLHGMHPVDDPMWTEKHKEVFKDSNTPNGTRAR